MNGAVAFHDARAARFDEGYRRSPAFQERFATWARVMASTIRRGDQVLDAGCGSGVFAFEAARLGGRVAAFDASEKMIGLCRAKQTELGTEIAFMQARLEDERAPASYDVVLCSSVLEYVADFDAALGALARLLRPGGRLLVSVPNADSLYRGFERLAFRSIRRPSYLAHVRHRLSGRELVARLEAAGLTAGEIVPYADPPVGGPLWALLPARRRKTLLLAVGTRAA